MHATDPFPALPAAAEVAAFRIAQEAVTNVVRHSGARRATVTLAVGDALRLEVRDDGAGLPADLRAGVGLASMRERATEPGGTCTIATCADAAPPSRSRSRSPFPDRRHRGSGCQSTEPK